MKLKDILNDFKDFKLITNFDIENKNISHVTVVDAPNVNKYIKGEELILSSGYIFKDNTELLIKCICEYQKMGCTALGIKVDRFLGEIPKKVIDFANSIKFPILNIPSKYPFADIINPILENVLDIKLKEMKLTENLYREFMQMIVENKSISDIFEKLHSIISKDFVFHNYFSGDVYYYGNNFEFENKFNHIIFGNGIDLGNFICNSKEEDFNYFEKMAINNCLAVINIKINNDILVAKTKEQYLSDFVTDIVNNNINSLEELNTRAKLLKKDISGSWQCVIFDIDNYKNTIIKKPDNNFDLEKTKGYMFNEIKKFLKTNDVVFHYFKKSDSIIFLLKNEDLSYLNLKSRLIIPIKNILRENFQNLTFTIGVGTIKKDIIQANLSYNEAMDSVRIGRLLNKENSIVYFKDVEFFKNLKDIIDLEEQTPHFVSDFKRVIDYSKENENDYIETLISLIENNWSIKRTSERQFLHYNTVKYRYEKIQSITQKDFENSNDRFLLELAYRYLKLKNEV